MSEAAATKEPEAKEGEEKEWGYDLFGCFGDIGLCVFTFCVPCYTIGRNAQFFGEDGVVVGILYGLGLYGLGPVLRWRTRKVKGIKGNMVADTLISCLCPCCALVQENKELYGGHGSHVGEKLPLTLDISRK